MKKILTAVGIGAALFGGSLAGPAPAAHANSSNCLTSPWGFLGLTKKRIICDGPIQSDGSWWRRRVIGVPAHYVNASSDCSIGSYYSHCTYYDGGWVDDRWDDDETYSVRPETVLPDEPGHLG
jgi:hypothetical protein